MSLIKNNQNIDMFTSKDSVEEIIEKIEKSQGVPSTINAGLAMLNYKLQAELLDNQNEYNKKQLSWSRILAIGTWALVIVTLLLVKFN